MITSFSTSIIFWLQLLDFSEKRGLEVFQKDFFLSNSDKVEAGKEISFSFLFSLATRFR